MAKNKKRDPRYTKLRAVKNSAKKAAAAAVLKRQQLKEAKEREAGNKEPSIDTDTGDEAQNNVEKSVASEEPVEEPGQELAPEREPVLIRGRLMRRNQLPKKKKRLPTKNLRLKLSQRSICGKCPSGWNAWLFNPDGSSKATKNKAQDADLEGGSSPPEKRRRMTRSTAKVGCSSDGQVTDDEVTRYFARKKIGLTNAKLRHRGPRSSKGHPSMAPKKVNSDAVKLRMQQKADAKLIAHHKAINKHWKGVSYWTDVEEDYKENDDENQETQFRQYSNAFTPEEPVGPVFSKFHPGDTPLHIFWSMLGGFQTFDLLLEKTNKRIRDSWNYVEKGNPPSRRFGGRPEGRQSSEMLPGGLVDRYELVAFLGIQFLMGYHRLPELSMYWERQPDTGYGLGIVHQAMTRERF
jgi:hypothetical protein